MELKIFDSSHWELVHAFLVYRKGGSNFVTANKILDQGNRIGPGRPVSLHGIYAALQRVVDKESVCAFRDDRILYQGPSFLVWWTPPMRRSIHFADSRNKVNGTAIDVGHPGLVWAVDARDIGNPLRVAAFKGKQRPKKDTVLYRAPYMNIWDGGKVCQGSGVIPKFTGNETMIPAWQESFFNSVFTHPNAREVLKGTSLPSFWRSQIESPSPRFPSSVLLPMGEHLDGWVRSLFSKD